MLELLTVTMLSFFFGSVGLLYKYHNTSQMEVEVPNPIKNKIKKPKNDFKKPKKFNEIHRHQNIKQIKPLYLIEQGYYVNGKLLNSYSSDGGKNWYVIPYGVINSNVQTILEITHPHVKIHKFAWEKLKNYVIKNGAIKLDDKKGVKLLERAGFDVLSRL